MALNIKDAETERLAPEVAAVKIPLQERKRRLELERPKKHTLRAFLEQEVWPNVPSEVCGKRVSKGEREAILGIGPAGW